jgi:SAM-dependent methyltransferase
VLSKPYLRKDGKICDMSIYTHPLCCEIAFRFFDVKEQIDCFEKIIRGFSKIKVECFLCVACELSLQLREIAKRGYECIGLDLSPEMLAYLRKKAKEEGKD